MIGTQQALERLKEGNLRFQEGRAQRSHTHAGEIRRHALMDGQAPFAIVLGCSDSRVPAEIVFDQGLGDLFVIRVAGNIASSSQIGSVEFAVENFATPLVVVLGHTGCGAIEAAVSQLRTDTRVSSENLQGIVDKIRPSVESSAGSMPAADRDSLVARVVRANIDVSVRTLMGRSPILRDKVRSGALMILGAEYCLESGAVVFLDH